MILTPQHSNYYFEKEDIKLEERILLKKTYGDNCIYFCACNHEVPYKLSSDYRFYPCDKTKKHDRTCPESEFYKTSQNRIPAYSETQEDGKTLIRVKINDLTRKSDVKGDSFVSTGRKCHDKVNALSLAGYLEILFLSSYATMKKSLKEDKKDIWKIAYAKICSTETIYNGKLVPMKGEKTPFKLFYGQLDKIKKEVRETKKGNINVYTLSLNNREVEVTEEDLDRAIKKYKELYKCSLKTDLMCVIRRMKSKYRIEKALYADTEIFFFPISKQGCICMNPFEQSVINEIEAMEEGQTAWYFYKPFEYGSGAFGDSYLEDGIINVRNHFQKICLNFIDLNNKDSLKIWQLKKKMFINDKHYQVLNFFSNKKFNAQQVMDTIKACK